ncbi:MAG TPA: ankyrin repeat domain-containing protein [Alphaproteobacteria bacterium]|jgi:ankyrin repeat protein|nr:ankyrin repeat domain-containing protein [Alphaproteobacteria bacterium]
MSIKDPFNAAAQAETIPKALGQQLLVLVQRKQDGAPGNHDLNERAIALVDQGASLTVTDPEHGRTPLMWASIYCRHRIIRAILARDPDILCRDKDNKTALELAQKYKSRPAVVLLEEAEEKRRAKVMEEAQDVSTRRETLIRKPLRLKNKAQGQDRGGQK